MVHYAKHNILILLSQLCPANMSFLFWGPRPPSGSLLMYNRKKVMFRRDGYCWKKRRDGKTNREDHMKLKVKGAEVTQCIEMGFSFFFFLCESLKQRFSMGPVFAYVQEAFLRAFLKRQGDFKRGEKERERGHC